MIPRHLGTGGKDALIRPWVWIALLFIGPFLGSVIFQWFVPLSSQLHHCQLNVTRQVHFHHREHL